MHSSAFVVAASLSCLLLVGCPNDPPRTPAGEPPANAAIASASPATTAIPSTPSAEEKLDAQEVVVAPGGDDPTAGHFTLADATAGLPGEGALTATIHTSEGDLACTLDSEHAPITVANFVGLARGKRPYKKSDGSWVKKLAYDGLTFHRIIKGFMVQGGDPDGTGGGGPGYMIADENRNGKHDRAGLLCMANRGPNTNGMQFFITDAPTTQLDGRNTTYTVFGECAPTSVVHAIAEVPTGAADRPTRPVQITSVRISRGTH